MRNLLKTAMLAVALTTTVSAFAEEPAYSTGTSDIGTLLDNPATKAVLEKYIPDMVSNAQFEMARPMTLKAIQAYAGDELSDEKLATIDADLAKIQVTTEEAKK
jgi:para-nitrobenzyl esterase